jgi:hypothetical protein
MTTAEICPNLKTHYPDQRRAEAALDRILRDPDPWREYNPCRVIQCHRCDDWVLTSRKQNPKSAEPLVRRKPAQRGRRVWSGGGGRARARDMRRGA